MKSRSLDASLSWLASSGDHRWLVQGLRGFEKECLRVAADGSLAETPHPAAWGSALTHPFLTTDYSEALVEFVTPPLRDADAALHFLEELQAFAAQTNADEMLWPSSMPCIIERDEAVPIAQYGPSNEGRLRSIYRSGLGFRYGRSMQAIAGIHFNFSLSPDLWAPWREFLDSDLEEAAFRSARMMGLVRNYRRFGWLVTYLFGASPAFCRSFRPDGHPRLEPLDRETWYAPHSTSLRMSDMGYRNSTQARLGISVNSLADYLTELEAALTTREPRYEAIGVIADGIYRQLSANVLQLENEYYSSIRPKPASKEPRLIAALRRSGVEYVEVRTLDLNPFAPLGVSERQTRFMELLLLHCLLESSDPISDSEQSEIDQRELAVAWEGRRPGLELGRDGERVALRQWALELVDRLEMIADSLGDERGRYAEAVKEARESIMQPETTLSARVLAELESGHCSFLEWALELARRQRRLAAEYVFEPGRRAELEAIARESLAEARALEAADELPFDEYLERYLAAGIAGSADRARKL
ncbi:MAG: glutamate--cysteine ligase [Gammaproteobacteria bacterium]